MFIEEDRKCFDMRTLEDAVDDVATDSGTGAEDSSVAHLLAELLAVLF